MNRRQFQKSNLILGTGLLAAASLNPFSTTVPESVRKILKTDTHVHLFNLAELTYPWLDNLPEIKYPYDIEDFAKAARKAKIGKIMFMESGAHPSQSLQEIDWVIEQAKLEKRLQGIIARGDLDIEGRLTPNPEQLVASGWVKGIRGRLNSELLQSSGFIQGMKTLAEHKLSFDLLLTPNLFLDAARAINHCPDTVFILDHLGNPNVKAGDDEVWKMGIRKLAQYPNVNCKISGAIVKIGKGWTADMLKPYVYEVIDSFGFDRIVYGSDWPNSLRVSDSYLDWSQVFEQLTTGFSISERNQLYHLNADRIYQLT
ncbi:MAG: amidohydrolase family protein [Saprospiraceae bacterium]|nr:amidohydrolase family protein [Saprospiraceae bacterium]